MYCWKYYCANILCATVKVTEDQSYHVCLPALVRSQHKIFKTRLNVSDAF